MRGAWQATIVDDNGNVQPFAGVEVRDQDGALVSLFDAPTGGSAISNPFDADGEGFARFYCDPQLVDITANTASGVRTWDNVLIPGTAATMPTSRFPYVVGSVAELASVPDGLLVDGARFDVTNVDSSGIRLYKWDASSTATTDDIGVVQHTGTATGRFIALTVSQERFVRSSREVVNIGQSLAVSNINTTARNVSPIKTYNGNQYFSFVSAEGLITQEKRNLATGEVETNVFGEQTDSFDTHWTPVLGIDREGYLYVTFNTRNDDGIKWRRSVNPEDISNWSGTFSNMTGQNENSAGNVQFFNGGDTGQPLLCVYRNGSASNANTILNAWDETGESWSQIQSPLIDGSVGSPTNSQYTWSPPYTPDGVIHLFFNFRAAGGVEANYNLCYARSDDGGNTWQNSQGAAYSLPITQDTAEIVDEITQGSSFQNYGHATTKPDGTPAAVYFRDDPFGIPQIYLSSLENGAWFRGGPVSDRKADFQLWETGELGTFRPYKMPIARSGVVFYPDGTPLIFTRGFEYGNCLEFYYRENGRWRHLVSESGSLIGQDMQWDKKLFHDTGELHLLIQPGSDVLAEAEFDYETDLDVWEFPTLDAALQKYSPKIKTGYQSARDHEGSRDVTEFVEIGSVVPYMTSSEYPTHARIIVNYESMDGSSVRLGLRHARDYDMDDPDANQSVLRILDKEVPGSSRNGTARRWFDSGWLEIPLGNINGDGPALGAAVSIEGGPASGTNVVRFRRYQLLLGTKTV